jgi:hypothetical protein
LASLDSQNQDRPQKVLGSDRPSDSSPEIPYDNYETPLTSPLLQNPSSKELPRSARSKHAATFDLDTMEPMLSAGRKRVRSDSITDLPAKVPRVSWKSAHHLPESSPALGRFRPMFYRQQSPEGAIPELPSPALHTNSDEDNDPDLPPHSLQNVTSSLISSSPPRTPPPKYARLQGNEKTLDSEDGADLLLFLANSPTPTRPGTKPRERELPPSTPPSQYATLPSLTPTPGGGVFPNFGTPTQQLNFADFVNVTPSPAQRPWGGRTPGGPCKTPLAMKDARKRLNFDTMIPPGESPKSRVKNSGLALQLGDELRR